MVAQPVKQHDYINQIVNPRLVYEKELDKKYGKKNDFKFTQFITEKERLVSCIIILLRTT